MSKKKSFFTIRVLVFQKVYVPNIKYQNYVEKDLIKNLIKKMQKLPSNI